MKNKISTILTVMVLLSVVTQGQYIYTCHTENTVHLLSSCCDKTKTVKSCCESANNNQEESFQKQCCSKVQLSMVQSVNESDIVSKKVQGSSPAFYFYSLRTLLFVHSAVTKFHKSKAPPFRQRQLYIRLCSFIC